MEKKEFARLKKLVSPAKGRNFSPFDMMSVLLAVAVFASVIVLLTYRPGPRVPAMPATLEQKMASLESGTPLATQPAPPAIPKWMMALILGFAIVQILPLLYAAHKARSKELTRREVRQIEFLAETPLHLGLLGSLLGVCLTQFITGSLAAPLAYLTTISGILLYLFGRFTVLVSLPSVNDLPSE